MVNLSHFRRKTAIAILCRLLKVALLLLGVLSESTCFTRSGKPPANITVEVDFTSNTDAQQRWVMDGSSITAIKLSGQNPDDALTTDDVKAFALTDSDTPPNPVDLAPSPMSGRVLGLRTAGGVLQTSWNQLSAGSPHFVLDTIPTPDQRAIGGLLPQGGVVLVRETENHPTQLWVRISPAFALILFHTFADPLVMPLASGMLPPASQYPDRVGLGGNHFYRSVNQGGDDKVVTIKDWGPTRVVVGDEPIKLPQELAYVGSVASPPAGNYILDANAWDRGSQIWIINETVNDNDWASWGGPVGYHSGHIYISNDDARKHINAASDVGRVLIIGHGSGQEARIVTAFAAATEDDWQWLPIGVDLGDIATQVMAHNASGAAHADIRALPEAAVTAHNAAGDAHTDIRTLISNLMAASGVTIGAYSDSATYSRGSSNSIVTHGTGLYVYVSGTQRSSNHDPGQFPGYWFKVSEGVTYFVMGDANYTIPARTLVIFDDTDETFLCTTNQHTARNKAYVRAQAASVGGAFIQLGYATIPRDKLPPVREWILNAEYRKGEIVDTTGSGHVHFIALSDNNSSNISNRKQPGTPNGVGVWDQLYTVDNPPAAVSIAPALTQIGTDANVSTNRREYVFAVATATALIAAWNAGTYYAFVVFVQSGTGAKTYSQFEFRRLPSTLAGVHHQIEFVHASSGSDDVADVQLVIDNRTNLIGLKLSGPNATFWATGSSASVYGVS